MAETMTKPRLAQRYQDELQAELGQKLGLANRMEIPTLDKIVVNMGIGEAAQNRGLLDGAVQDLSVITGQKPALTQAKKSIATFKLRAGDKIGAKVTLRGPRMWEFFDRLVTLAIPRIRDFRGMSIKQFDGNGNYTFGVDEQLIFPEIDYDNVDKTRGMDITIVTTAQSDEHGFELMSLLGFPFQKAS